MELALLHQALMIILDNLKFLSKLILNYIKKQLYKNFQKDEEKSDEVTSVGRW